MDDEHVLSVEASRNPLISTTVRALCVSLLNLGMTNNFSDGNEAFMVSNFDSTPPPPPTHETLLQLKSMI